MLPKSPEKLTWNGSIWLDTAHIKTGRSRVAQDHFQTPPDPKEGYKNWRFAKKEVRRFSFEPPDLADLGINALVQLVRSPDPQPREVKFEKCCVNLVDSFRYTIGTVYLMSSLCFSYCASKQKSNSEIWIYRHRKIEEYRPIALCARCVIPYKYGRCCMFSSGNVRKSL